MEDIIEMSNNSSKSKMVLELDHIDDIDYPSFSIESGNTMYSDDLEFQEIEDTEEEEECTGLFSQEIVDSEKNVKGAESFDGNLGVTNGSIQNLHNEHLDFEDLFLGEHSLTKEEILEIDGLFLELTSKALELEAVEISVGNIISSSLFRAGMSAFYKDKESRIIELVFKRVMDEYDTDEGNGRKIEDIYRELKILELTQLEAESIRSGKKNVVDVLTGKPIYFSAERLHKNLIKSETMLCPIHELFVNILDTAGDNGISSIYEKETMDMMTGGLYAEDIFRIF